MYEKICLFQYISKFDYKKYVLVFAMFFSLLHFIVVIYELRLYFCNKIIQFYLTNCYHTLSFWNQTLYKK